MRAKDTPDPLFNVTSDTQETILYVSHKLFSSILDGTDVFPVQNKSDK